VNAPIDLNRIRACAEVHRTGSFSVAARHLGVPRSTISRAVAALEEDTGVRLFHRTTRAVSTTPAGLALFERVGPLLASLDRSLADLSDAFEEPSGTLRITTTVDLGATLLAEAVARYTARHPAVQIEVNLSGAVVDLVRERFDLAVRFAMGKLESSTLVARRLGTVRFEFYASPAYMARKGAPKNESDLASHDLVGLRRGQRPARTICDDKLFAREVARAGGGIAMLPAYLAAEDVADGRLVRILPNLAQTVGAVFLVLPSQKLVPRRVSLFRDLLLEQIRRRPLG
jgi:DNA-binding transcriptional LysR family regulator